MEYGRIGVDPGTEQIGGFDKSGRNFEAVLKKPLTEPP